MAADAFGAGTIENLIIHGTFDNGIIGAGLTPTGGVFDMQWMVDNNAFVDTSLIKHVTLGTFTNSEMGSYEFELDGYDPLVAMSTTGITIAGAPVHPDLHPDIYREI